MDSLKAFLKTGIRPKKVPRTSERAELLSFFADRINMDRRGTRYKPLSIPRVAKLLQGLTTKDLHYMISVFKDLERNKGLQSACKNFFFSLREQK